MLSDEPQIPKLFSCFVAEVRELFAAKPGAPRLTIIGPSAVQLVAENAEGTTTYRALALELFPAKQNSSALNTAFNIFRRSGFYGRVESGDTDEQLWELITPFTKARDAVWATLLMLDGCSFPVKKFEFLGYTINKLSDEERGAFEPPRDFISFSDCLAPSFSERWSLLYKQDSHIRSPSSVRIPQYELHVTHWKPLFGLGLYERECFYISKIVQGEPGFNFFRIRDEPVRTEFVYEPSGEPHEIPAEYYKVTDEEWASFQDYLKFFEKAMANIEKWDAKRQRLIRMAGRRYLRATFISHPDGDAFPEDNREDVLLQYMFGLESLLLPGESRGGIADKIAIRGALIVGKDDAERDELRGLLKKLYASRSNLAHGHELSQPLDLPRLREIYRAVALVILKLSESRSSSELQNVLMTLATSDGIRGEVREARNAVLGIVRSLNLAPTGGR